MPGSLDPVPLLERERPSRLIRLMLALSTMPLPADPTESPPLNAFITRLTVAGWTIRQAYYRNWTIWRNTSGHARGLIVLPMERPKSNALHAIFIAVELLRGVTGKWPIDMTLVDQLVPNRLAAPPGKSCEEYRAAELELIGWKLWR
ncbi:hypothetical protein [Hephaestia mangrovi]|uniref:hypothetical protein n=1 Tax=Hephaestia mangrovi TaxID=2873268 RepID=UPI001CA6E081|nr:hypothetical protein [Hephaestia mangrovi]MBY8826563.1 hypothetical protein [Hephaestia mangrovi]